MVVICVRRCPGVDSIVEVSLVRSREGVLQAKNVSVADAPPNAKDVEVSMGRTFVHHAYGFGPTDIHSSSCKL